MMKQGSDSHGPAIVRVCGTRSPMSCLLPPSPRTVLPLVLLYLKTQLTHQPARHITVHALPTENIQTAWIRSSWLRLKIYLQIRQEIRVDGPLQSPLALIKCMDEFGSSQFVDELLLWGLERFSAIIQHHISLRLDFICPCRPSCLRLAIFSPMIFLPTRSVSACKPRRTQDERYIWRLLAHNRVLLADGIASFSMLREELVCPIRTCTDGDSFVVTIAAGGFLQLSELIMRIHYWYQGASPVIRRYP